MWTQPLDGDDAREARRAGQAAQVHARHPAARERLEDVVATDPLPRAPLRRRRVARDSLG